MKIVLLLCMCWLQVLPGQRSRVCRYPVLRGYIAPVRTYFGLKTSCASFERAFITGSGGIAAISFTDGTLHNSICSVYEGENKNGALLGTFTGDGTATGFVKSNTDSLYLSCPTLLNVTSNANFPLIKVTEEASCDFVWDVDDLPKTLALPTSSDGRIMQGLTCNYTVTSRTRRNFTITVSSGLDGSTANKIFILSDDPSNPGISINYRTVPRSVHARRINVLIFTWSSSYMTTIHIDSDETFSECQPSILSAPSAKFHIPSSCTSYQRELATDSGGTAALNFIYKTLGNNICSVYEGSNKNGVLLGTFTGDGSATGILKSNTGSMYLSCPTLRGITSNVYFQFIKVTEEASCDFNWSVKDLPKTLQLPTLTNVNLLPKLACNYTVTSPVRRDFTVTVSSGLMYSSTDSIFILSDDPSHFGTRIKYSNRQTIATVHARRVYVQIFTSVNPSSPTIHIDLGKSICRPSVLSGSRTQFQIPLSCTSYERMLTTGNGGTAAMHMYRYTLGNNTCSVYKGENKNGVLLGTFTGDGSATGIVKSNTGSLYLSCPTLRGNIEYPYFEFIKATEEASCDSEFNVKDLPNSLALSTSNDGKLMQGLACNYTVSSPIRCNFTITVFNWLISSVNTIYILSDDPSHHGSKPASWDGSKTVSTTVQARRVNVQIITWDTPITTPTIRIMPDCESSREIKVNNPMEMNKTTEKCNTKSLTTKTVPNRGPLFQPATVSSKGFNPLRTSGEETTTNLNSLPESSTSTFQPKRIKNFTINLELFGDEQMRTPLTCQSVVIIPEYVYAKLKLTSHRELDLQVKSCSIASNDDFESGGHSIISESCKVEHETEAEDAIVVTRNYQPSFATFKFRSFLLDASLNQQSLYAHCYVALCDNSNGGCPRPNCSQNHQRRFAQESSVKVISVGPFPVSIQDLCQKKNGECSDFCNVMNGIVHCSCFEGRYFNKNKNTCIDVKETLQSGGTKSLEGVYIAVGFIALLLIIVLGFIIICLKRRYNEKSNMLIKLPDNY